MLVRREFKRITSLVLALALVLSMFTVMPSMASTPTDEGHVIINQVFGGSDDGYASHSFIELYNPTDQDVDLSNWSLQYRSSEDGDNADAWVKLDLTGAISSGDYFLVRCAEVTSPSGAYAVPKGNQEWPELVIHNKGISVALVNNQETLDESVKGDVTDNENIIDLAAAAGSDYKSSKPTSYTDQLSPAWEGEVGLTGTNGIQSKKKAIRRTNFVDTNNSASDFTTVDYSATVSEANGPHVGNAASTPETPEEPVETLEAVDWKGSETPTTVTNFTFLEDSSGLDFYNDQLYLIDNGTGIFWVMNVDENGVPTSYAEGYSAGEEGGKRIRFQKDADNPDAAGPDTEGITVDGNGYVYAAAERDNEAKSTNYNVILKVDPNTEDTDLVAMTEWNLTDLLPSVAANTGIEAVEWVANTELEGKLWDENLNTIYSSSNYSSATADGVFFVAMEANGYVYALALNDDGTATLISTIDTKLSMAMGLDYDTHDQVLRVATDNGYSCRMAQVTFNRTDTPDIVHVRANENLDTTQNFEGFAVADYKYTVDGKRPVYRCIDGVDSGALVIDYLVYDTEGGDAGSGDGDGGGENEGIDPDTGDEGTPDTETTAVYRLYNATTSEHLYTTSENEYNTLVTYGWTLEDVAWQAPEKSETAVYRLYNKVSGDHHYTTDENEVATLVAEYGWTFEGVAFYSSDEESGTAVYRLYNSGLTTGQHHFTTDENEYNTLETDCGWAKEDIAWYALAA